MSKQTSPVSRTLYTRHVPDDVAEQLGATLLTADARAVRAPGLLCGVELRSGNALG